MCVNVTLLLDPDAKIVAVSRLVKVLLRLLNWSMDTFPPERMDTISSRPLPVKSPKAKSMMFDACVTLICGSNPPDEVFVK